MFCVTTNEGEEVVVIEVRPNIWEASHENGDHSTFEAVGIAAAAEIAKTLESECDCGWCSACNEDDYN